MKILLPPKNLHLEHYKYDKSKAVLSWDGIDDYCMIYQAQESFEDAMKYNYDRLKGYYRDHYIDSIQKHNHVSHITISNFDLSIHTTYYFVITAYSYGMAEESEPSEEVSIYV